MNHIANFFLPSLVLALALSLGSALWGAFKGRKTLKTRPLRVLGGGVVLFLVGAGCQTALLLGGFKDGSVEGYAALMGVLALTHWLMSWSLRGSKKGWAQSPSC